VLNSLNKSMPSEFLITNHTRIRVRCFVYVFWFSRQLVIQMSLFCVFTSRRLCSFRRFGETFCLHDQGGEIWLRWMFQHNTAECEDPKDHHSCVYCIMEPTLIINSIQRNKARYRLPRDMPS
jgi:hypothetical protein